MPPDLGSEALDSAFFGDPKEPTFLGFPIMISLYKSLKGR